MKKDNKTKKNSVMKKLVPATGMLLVSAIMLTTSTYAWFTMSKEVEVTGIKMTASVPEDIQISLGHGTNSTDGLKDGTSSSSGATFVQATSAGSTTRTLTVGDPSTDAGTTDWTNAVAISDYYTFGRITPATSKDGNAIFFTKDATASGRALLQDTFDANQKALTGKSYAEFIQANNSNSKYQAWTEPNDSKGSAMTTTTVGETTGVTISEIDRTGGGYYVDIPVWFRTSIYSASAANVQLAVKATITPKKDTSGTADPVTTPDLYLAARCAMIPSSGSAVGAIMDSTTKYYHTENGVLNNSSGYAPASAYTVNAATNSSTAPTWVAVDPVTQCSTISDGMATDGEPVVVVPKSISDGSYGSVAAYTLRVWLEGEDLNCWDQTAAQDFQIDLRFIRLN